MNKSIQYSGATLHYQVEGKGRPVMLVHGFGEDSYVWNYIVNSLKDQFRFIIPDLPGSGKSELPEADVSMESLAASLYALLSEEFGGIDSLKGQVIMIGHSMGGYITLAFAEKYPQLLKAFGLFHSTAFADSEEKIATRRKGIAFMKEHGAAKFMEQATPNLFSEHSKQQNAELVADITARYTNFSVKSLVSYYEAMISRPDRTNILKQFNGPILFIMGQHDNAIPLKDILLQCHFPRISYIQLLADSGHMGMLEEPAKSTSFLGKFLTECEMDVLD